MSVVDSIEAEYRRYKALADAAIEQVSDEELAAAAPGGGNSIEMMVRHIAGNLQSRFTDFRTSDGEKPWRHRDGEFEAAALNRRELLDAWEAGWQALFGAVSALGDDDLADTVTIRRQPLRIDEALHRSLAHAAYHVGQIVLLAKTMRGEAWRCLSIPRGMSEAFNKQGIRDADRSGARRLAEEAVGFVAPASTPSLLHFPRAIHPVGPRDGEKKEQQPFDRGILRRVAARQAKGVVVPDVSQGGHAAPEYVTPGAVHRPRVAHVQRHGARPDRALDDHHRYKPMDRRSRRSMAEHVEHPVADHHRGKQAPRRGDHRGARRRSRQAQPTRTGSSPDRG